MVAALIGILTACVAFLVDVAEATVSDWKLGYCKHNPFMAREACCEGRTPVDGPGLHRESDPSHLAKLGVEVGASCPEFSEWTSHRAGQFAVYVGFALAFGLASACVTLCTKRSLPAASPGTGDMDLYHGGPRPMARGKTMFMAAGGYFASSGVKQA